MPEDPLVSTEWLHEHLGDERVKPVDASWYLPGVPRDPKAEFAEARVPGAVFFDIDEIADHGSPWPHMAPSPEQFVEQAGALGIASDDTVVVYDGAGLFSAARAWWMFRLYGHGKVFVLDGGFPKWRAEGRPVETAPPVSPAPAVFAAHLDAAIVRNTEQVRAALSSGSEQVLDVRSAQRFRGEAPEPRPGVRPGHMPGALNLPIGDFVRPDGTLLGADQLAHLLLTTGIDLDRPIVTSCGSGITASAAALGLARLGHWHTAVYDGSWSEWGGRTDTPVVTGP